MRTILQTISRSRVRFIILLLLVTISIVVSLIYNPGVEQLARRQTNSLSPESPTRTKVVAHALGEVEIPVHPTRVIVLDEQLLLDPVLTLGVKPIGVLPCQGCEENFRGIPDDLVAGISRVSGSGSEPSLEKILSLKPDLILARTHLSNSYKLLSKIAPTVIVDFSKLYDFKERLRYIANVLEKRDLAETLLNQYQGRVQILREQLESQLETKTVSVIYLARSADVFYTYKPDFLAYGQILRDIGLQRPFPQQNQIELESVLSLEALPEHDADILFIMTEFLTAEFRQKISEDLSFLKHPIWSQLKAVQNNQVYRVNWTVGGLIGANRILDDLEKYLVRQGE